MILLYILILVSFTNKIIGSEGAQKGGVEKTTQGISIGIFKVLLKEIETDLKERLLALKNSDKYIESSLFVQKEMRLIEANICSKECVNKYRLNSEDEFLLSNHLNHIATVGTLYHIYKNAIRFFYFTSGLLLSNVFYLKFFSKRSL